MSGIKRCKKCGVPSTVSKGHTWGDNGVMVQTASGHRMVFFESDNLDGLFAGIERILGLSIEKIIIESKRREVKRYVEGMLSPLARKLARRVGVGMVIDKLSRDGRAFGYGDIGLVDRRGKGDDGDFITMSVRNPHSLALFCGEVLGAWECIDGREHQVEHLLTGPDAYNVTCRVGPHPIELRERLQFKVFDHKPGDFRLDRCPACDVPVSVARYRWELEQGTIRHPRSGARMAIFGPTGIEAILDDLESELGETIPEVVIEAQRRYVRETMADLGLLADPARFRRMLAFRGVCDLSGFSSDDGCLDVEVRNACMPLVQVGIFQGLFELLNGLEASSYQYERAADGDLCIRLAPA